ncbi:MDR family MFS transporter [Streptacidiphilus fuscans]|uniref:MFS transporter n=1 Tax=Streptacidiphilus fuscans TaxID=2789292 RepID=A0A931AZP1_9ACTN|nr:MFS transporter [Streptacidiphilus fuscans]MBF9066427.1 MFS transporter [Streptacidiphilus fuscans]
MAVPARVRVALNETVGGLPTTFWWLWTSTLVNRLGSFVVTFLTLYLTTTRGLSPAVAGLVVSSYGLGGVFGAILGGVLADRIGRRPTLVTAQTLTAVTTVALGYTHAPVLIAVVAALLGLTSNAARPAISAIMADLVPSVDRVRAFSLNYWAVNIGFAISASVAGLIAAHGFLLLFYGDAITTLLCALVVFLRIPETRPEQTTTASGTGVSESAEGSVGMGTVFRDRAFMGLVGLTFLLAMVIGQDGVAVPVVMGRQGFSATEYGLVIAVNGLLIVLGQIPVTRLVQKGSRKAALISAALLLGFGTALCAFAGSLWFYALTVVVWTCGEMIWTPANQAMVAELSPTHGRGRYQGVFSLAWQGSSFLAPLSAGFMLSAWGANSVWAVCAVLGVLCAGGYVLLMRGRANGLHVVRMDDGAAKHGAVDSGARGRGAVDSGLVDDGARDGGCDNNSGASVGVAC